MTGQTTRNTVQSIQILRFVAAMAVVFAHLDNVLNMMGHDLYIGRMGGMGVDVFFVISGFVMAMILDGTPPGGKEAYAFARKRVARIVPIYWLVTLVVVWLVPSSREGSTLPTSLFFMDTTPIVDVGWTLVYEMYFYSLLAIAVWTTATLGKRLVLTAALVVLGYGLGTIAPAFAPLARPVVFEFVLGMGVYLLYRAQMVTPAVGTLAGLAATAVVASVWADVERLPGDAMWMVAATGVVIAFLACEPALKQPVWSKLGKLGDASYSLYLVHLYILYLAAEAMERTSWTAPYEVCFVAGIGVFVSLALSHFLYVCIEKPLSVHLAGKR